jgi:protoporphyrinogen oxidase
MAMTTQHSALRINPQSMMILGGGPAGLSAAYFAVKSGVPVTVLEAADEVGGNARTLRHGEFRFDTGAHRFHDKHAVITREIKSLLGDELLLAAAPSQILWRNRRIDFPLSPVNLLGNLGPATMARAAIDFAAGRGQARGTTLSLESLAVARYGRTVADLFLLQYSEKLWGLPANRLSPFVSGQRLRGLNLRTFLVEALRGSRAKTEHLDGKFYYPRLGIGVVMERLAARIGDERIRTRSRVTRLFHRGGRISAVEINHRERVAAEQVVSSLPISTCVALLDPAPPAAVLEAAANLRYRHVALLVLLLNRPRVTRNASLYFPEREVPFTRAYEPKNRSAAMAPEQQTSLVVEFPCGIEDEIWRRDAAGLAEVAVPILERKRLLHAADVMDVTMARVPFAYPVLECGIEDAVRALTDYLQGFENLQLAGRNGLFNYTHIHDLLEAGRLMVQAQRRTEVATST